MAIRYPQQRQQFDLVGYNFGFGNGFSLFGCGVAYSRMKILIHVEEICYDDGFQTYGLSQLNQQLRL